MAAWTAVTGPQIPVVASVLLLETETTDTGPLEDGEPGEEGAAGLFLTSLDPPRNGSLDRSQ